MGPGPPPLGPWGASQGVPGGGSRPNVLGPELAKPIGFRIVFYVDFDVDF